MCNIRSVRDFVRKLWFWVTCVFSYVCMFSDVSYSVVTLHYNVIPIYYSKRYYEKCNNMFSMPDPDLSVTAKAISEVNLFCTLNI